MRWLRRLFSRILSILRIRRRPPPKSHNEVWQINWSRADYTAPWMGRGAGPDLERAVGNRWFHVGGAVLDIGCGQGELVGWFAESGFPAVGVDVAEAAIVRARQRYAEVPGQLEFHAVDMCTQKPPAPPGGYLNLVDRGCLHQIPAELVATFGRNIAAVCAPGARLVVFSSAFRDPARAEQEEFERVQKKVDQAFGDSFHVERVERIFMDPDFGTKPESALGGIATWLRQREST